LAIGIVGAAIVFSLLVIANSERGFRVSLMRESLEQSDESEPSERKDAANRDSTKKQARGSAFANLRTDQQFEEAIFNGSKLDDFILQHIPRAESGDPDSAYYLAEAMNYCSMELVQFNMSFAYYDTQNSDYDTQNSEAASNLDHQVQVIMDGLIGKPEFYQRQVRRHLDRAIACKSLGMDSQDLYRQVGVWAKQATTLMQPIALARAARLDPRNPSIAADRLNNSKAVMRDALSRNRDLMTLLHASSVAAVATGRDYATERLAWGILACEYTECDTLNYLYLGKCEAMVLSGNADCSEEISDLDYLRLKYPDIFDVARGRASELYVALEKEDWATVGLN
jgi:hypothetical protein